jgi:parallel beta-helix repeat protein
VATTGSDANPGSQSQPFQTIDRGVRALHGGDTLYIRGGTYVNQNLGYYGPTPIPNGTSWATATTIAAYSGETVWLKEAGIAMVNGNAYIIFDGLHFDNGGLYLDSSAHHIRFQNGEFTNSQSSGANMFIQGSGWNLEVLNTKIHNAGGGDAGKGCTDIWGCYGMYWEGRDSLFDGNEVYDNAGYGFHIYHSGDNDVANNIVRNSTFYNNGFFDLRPIFGCGLIVSSGPNNQVYNNVVYNNFCGIQVDYRCTNCQVSNNTIYDNLYQGIGIGSGALNTIVEDNITYQNGFDIEDDGVGTVLINNLTTNP